MIVFENSCSLGSKQCFLIPSLTCSGLQPSGKRNVFQDIASRTAADVKPLFTGHDAQHFAITPGAYVPSTYLCTYLLAFCEKLHKFSLQCMHAQRYLCRRSPYSARLLNGCGICAGCDCGCTVSQKNDDPSQELKCAKGALGRQTAQVNQ